MHKKNMGEYLGNKNKKYYTIMFIIEYHTNYNKIHLNTNLYFYISHKIAKIFDLEQTLNVIILSDKIKTLTTSYNC